MLMTSVNMPIVSPTVYRNLAACPTSTPARLVQRSATQYVEGENLADMIREDLIGERIVIDVYRDLIRFFADKDPTPA